MIDKEHALHVDRQCSLLSVSHSSVYKEPSPVPAQDREVIRVLDEIHLHRVYLGSRRLVDELKEKGVTVNEKRLWRLMRLMGVSATYPRWRTTRPGSGVAHRVYPYLLGGHETERPQDKADRLQ